MVRTAITEVKQTGPDEVTISLANGSTSKMAAHVWNIRLLGIKHGLEWEIRFPGGRLTRKAPSCFTIIKQELGIKTRDKVKAYRAFCALTGQIPHKDIAKE
mgnify:CR=1 FL=1